MHGPCATQWSNSTTVHIKFVPPVSGLPSLVEAQTSVTRASTSVVLAPSPWSCTLTVALHWSSHASRYQSSWNIWMCSFKIYRRWSVQASKHRYTCVSNAVTLVWGSLKLAPINSVTYKHFTVVVMMWTFISLWWGYIIMLFDLFIFLSYSSMWWTCAFTPTQSVSWLLEWYMYTLSYIATHWQTCKI